MVVAPTARTDAWPEPRQALEAEAREPAIDSLSQAERAVLAELWTRAAQGEHASIASFSRFTQV